MSNWWISQTGKNTLKGVEGDAYNPIQLPDDFIIDFLTTVPKARFDFGKLYPTLLPEEQERLKDIISRYSILKDKLDIDHQEDTENFSENLNSNDVIYTSGPLGGTGVGG